MYIIIIIFTCQHHNSHWLLDVLSHRFVLQLSVSWRNTCFNQPSQIPSLESGRTAQDRWCVNISIELQACWWPQVTFVPWINTRFNQQSQIPGLEPDQDWHQRTARWGVNIYTATGLLMSPSNPQVTFVPWISTRFNQRSQIPSQEGQKIEEVSTSTQSLACWCSQSSPFFVSLVLLYVHRNHQAY